MKKLESAALTLALAFMAGCGGEADGQTIDDDSGSQTASSDSDSSVIVDPQSVDTQELKDAVSDSRVREFYEGRDWKPAWTQDAAASIVPALRGAGRHGLDPADYIGPVRNAEGATAREAALTGAAIDLADALGEGKADPGELFSVYTLPRPEFDLVAGLSGALGKGNVGEWIESLAPSDAEYRALSQAYVKYAKLAAQGDESTIEDGDLIKVGESDPRVPQIARLLRNQDYLSDQNGTQGNQSDRQSDRQSDPQSEPNRYTERMAKAVEKIQSDFGISDDGVIGPETLKVLNIGPSERARLLAINLERRRWIERNPPPTRIDVNIADAVLDYYEDGERADRRPVVVGQPGWETPQLGSAMYRLVANPTWTVPKSIEEEEIAPRGPGYLQRNNMVRRDGWIVQLPGPENALGEVKFDMRNDQAIYLHDTPATSLFDRTQRHLSHGCIRVENALQFARMIAREQGIMSDYGEAQASGSETFVDLPDNIPVRLLYQTAFLDPSGDVHFRTDPYGWDERVAEALGYEPRQSARLDTHISDVGP